MLTGWTLVQLAAAGFVLAGWVELLGAVFVSNTNTLSCGNWASPAMPINYVPTHFPVHCLWISWGAASGTLLRACKKFLPCVCGVIHVLL